MNIQELNLLVVEDDVFQRQLIVNMLRSLGAQRIAEAGNGKQALELVKNPDGVRFDLVVCDLNMPEMDGLEFLRHLSTESIPPTVVIVSALDERLLSSADRMAKMYGMRLLGTLQKPITLNYLKEVLTKYDVAEKKWQPDAALPVLTLDEILLGLQGHQFEAYFQPKVDIRSGRLVGAEALARWAHPTLGVLTPYVFIPTLEQYRQLDELTFEMLRQSAEACREFHAQGHILTISVNLSLTSLSDASLADKIINTVKKAGVDPHYIILEITESAAMTDVGHALENLTRLCMNGFILSIDDYGTGYSSMQQLTRIAFGELKIDQSFVKDAALNEALRIVVESSIDMAHKLQVKSVAEGVETKQDWDMLHHAGCDSAQGYFISRPLSRFAFAQFMAEFKSQALSPSQAHQNKRDSLRILVVEDDDFVRGIILHILRDLGYLQVIEAASAAAALRLLESHPIDLLMTDVDMPSMNGLELTHLIRTGKTLAKSDTRVLVLTAYSNAEMLGVALALDVNGFLVKPIIPAVLDEKIALALVEKMKLRPANAYQAVMTELHNLPSTEVSPTKSMGAVVIKGQASLPVVSGGRSVGLNWLRAGMVLRENVHTKDNTLLMKAGQKLTDLSINRLNDLSSFLNSKNFLVDIPTENSD